QVLLGLARPVEDAADRAVALEADLDAAAGLRVEPAELERRAADRGAADEHLGARRGAVHLHLHDDRIEARHHGALAAVGRHQALGAGRVEPDELLLARLALERGRGRIRTLLAVDRDHRALRARVHLYGRLAATRPAGGAAVDRDEGAGDGRGEHRRAGGDPD